MTALQILDIPASPVATAVRPFLSNGIFLTFSQCASNLTETTGLFTACNNDPQCLCGSAAVTSFVNTETCMFNNLIKTNVKSPSPLAGSNVLVGGAHLAVAVLTVANPA